MWWAALRKGVVALFIFAFFVCAWANDWDSGFSEGRQFGRQTLGGLEERDDLKRNIVNPALGAQQMPYIGGGSIYRCESNNATYYDRETCERVCSGECRAESGFDVQVSNPSSRAFLKVTARPSSTGDLDPVIIQQDTDMDGRVDYSYTVSGAVSGVCTHGFISCDPGTWNMCKFYRWVAHDGKVEVQEVPSNRELGVCYCINNSCGSRLVWTNLSSVLKDLGGGVVGAILASDPHYAISDVKVEDVTISYYGQRTRSTAGTRAAAWSSVGTGETDPSHYFSAPATLEGAAEDMVVFQSGDPDSYYSMLGTELKETQQASDVRECVIRHTPTLSEERELVGYDITFRGGWDRNGGSKNCWYYVNSCVELAEDDDSWSVCYSRIINASTLGKIVRQVLWTTDNCVPYTDPVSGASGCLPPPESVDVSDWEFLETPVELNEGGCFGTGPEDIVYVYKMRVFTKPHDGMILIKDGKLVWGVRPDIGMGETNTCRDIDTEHCRLMEEYICDMEGSNCIQTWRNFQPTGLRPLPVCKQIGTRVDVYTFCADGSQITVEYSQGRKTLVSGEDAWWTVKRKYLCNQEPLNFDDIKRRTTHIETTLDVQGRTMSYEDLNTETGETESYRADLPFMGEWEDCEKVCKVKINRENQTLGVDENQQPVRRQDYRATEDNYFIVNRRCENDWCPHAADEEVVSPCQCRSDFSEATSYLEAINKAAKDMICSSDPP